jgi:hypothetical protein
VSIEIVRKAWVGLGDERRACEFRAASPAVSTNRVYRIVLEDATCVFAKLVTYGSAIHFRQDHQRISRWITELSGSRFENFLAPVLQKSGEPYVYCDGPNWVVFYGEVQVAETLPRRLDESDIRSLAREMAEFHRASAESSAGLDPTWKTLGSDVAALFDRVAAPQWREKNGLTRAQVAVIQRHCESFFHNAERLGYHRFKKIPLLVDWNITNFSITREQGELRFFSRWDYDWFRIEPRMLDFYFMSRVVRNEGDTSRFSYSPEIFLEPRFRLFLEKYHQCNPIEFEELLFLKEVYRFFVLVYVLHLGEHFFQYSLCKRLQHEAVEIYLPAADALDLRELGSILR